ncbi:MAG: hypothetical protein R3Y58_02005 [Eubacteriales bacterium]
MFISIGNSKASGPMAITKVLNKEECGVTNVGASLKGNLNYRIPGRIRPLEDGIVRVAILKSTINRRLKDNNITAEFDILLEDGNVVEVSTNSPVVLRAAMKYTQRIDIRTARREARGCFI